VLRSSMKRRVVMGTATSKSGMGMRNKVASLEFLRQIATVTNN